MFAVTATFQQGASSYTGTSDCTIVDFSTNEHITDATRIRDTNYLYLLHFDISSIPDDATVSSASVQLYLSEQNCSNETIAVVEIENPNDSGAFADNESSTSAFNAYANWLYKNDTDNTDWSTAESNSFADVDDNAAESTNTTGACPGSVAKSFTVTTMVAGWVADPDTNGGMFFKMNDGSGNATVANKRNGTESVRPKLTVEYTEAASGRRVMITQ